MIIIIIILVIIIMIIMMMIISILILIVLIYAACNSIRCFFNITELMFAFSGFVIIIISHVTRRDKPVCFDTRSFFWIFF